MGDIAQEADVSNGGLYRYFENKLDVFAALIADLHESLYQASGHTKHSVGSNPYGALEEANRGYVAMYFDNRDVMRAFTEAAVVDERFRLIWWSMRRRHVGRFMASVDGLKLGHAMTGVDPAVAAEAMACMVEQCCYVWFAHDDMNERPVSVDAAVKAMTNAWHATFFGR